MWSYKLTFIFIKTRNVGQKSQEDGHRIEQKITKEVTQGEKKRIWEETEGGCALERQR
jgi:hypothetical protein